MKVTRTTTTPCGCEATFDGIFLGYTVEAHACDGTTLANEREARIEQATRLAQESYERNTAPLYHEPFSILKGKRP